MIFYLLPLDYLHEPMTIYEDMNNSLHFP